MNGHDSLSGCHSIRFWLHETKRNFNEYSFIETGGHSRTCSLISQGKLDCGAIDVVCLLRLRKENPDVWKELRVLTDTMLGPYPAQPVTLASYDENKRDAFIRGFQEVSKETLARAFVSEFQAISDDTYDVLAKLFEETRYLDMNILPFKGFQESKI